jgi:hypothetical protein
MHVPPRAGLHFGNTFCRAPNLARLGMGASLSRAAGAHVRRICNRRAIDVLARLMGQWLSERPGQQFVIGRRPGPGGDIAADAGCVRLRTVMRCAPSAPITRSMRPVTKKLNFNLLRDVEQAGIYRVSLVMELHPSFPARTAPEFIAYAKADLGKVQSLALGRSRSPGGRGKSALLEAESAIDLFQEEAPVLACTRGLSRRLS